MRVSLLLSLPLHPKGLSSPISHHAVVASLYFCDRAMDFVCNRWPFGFYTTPLFEAVLRGFVACGALS